MTTLEQRLAETLAEHWEDYPAGCGCGTTVGIATGDVLDHAEFHRAHVAAHLAATVREWLGEQLAGEGLREAVAEAIGDAWLDDGHGLACEYRDAPHDVTSESSAAAALAAVREHLTGEGSDG